MSNDNNEVTRRKFIKRTAGTFGALGIGLASGTEVFAHCHQPTYSVTAGSQSWNVKVDPRARITLYLLETQSDDIKFKKTLYRTLFKHDFRRVLGYMKSRLHLTAGDNRQTIIDILRQHTDAPEGGEIEHLEAAFVTVRDEIGNDNRSYFSWATDIDSDGKSTISDELQTALLQLGELIAMPLNREYFPAYRAFYALPEREIFEEFCRNPRLHTLNDLFTKKHSQVTPEGDRVLKAIHAARDHGILWCQPRGNRVPISAPKFEKTGNGCKCDMSDPQNPKCTYTGDNDDYCAIVDGECSTMST